MATKPAAKGKPQPVAVRDDTLPEWYAKAQEKSARGSENVGIDDIIVPRLEIVQALSPCKKKSDPTYIEDADDGMLYNSVTRELYGDEVRVIPIYYTKQWLVWVDRTKSDGQGFRGSFNSAEAAQEKVASLDEDDLQIVDTAQQFCVLVHDDGRREDIVLSMSRSKMKIARQWNSIIRGFPGDRWMRSYTITTAEEKGKKGTFYNFHVDTGRPQLDRALYDFCARKYESIAQGVTSGKVKADMTGETIEGNAEHDNSNY